jgi:hypothetical protein
MSAMVRHAALAFGVAFLATPASARAEEPQAFGARAPLVIVVDHLFGLTHTTPEFTQIGSPLTIAGPTAARLGVHGFIAGTVSLGIGVQWWSERRDGGARTIVAASPRVGFALPIDPHNAIWFRAGGGYLRVTQGDDLRATAWSIGGEIAYVYTPVRHFGVMIGPMIDVGVASSSSSSRGTTQPTTPRNVYGFTLGLLFDL